MAVVAGPHASSQELGEQAGSLAVRWRVPWSRALGPAFARFSTAVEGRLTMHWGGYTDRPIEAWHSFSGAFNFRRADYPRNQLHLLFADDGGRAFALDGGSAFAAGDLVLRNQVTLAEAPGWGVAARLDLKLPVGSLGRAAGSGGVHGRPRPLRAVGAASLADLHRPLSPNAVLERG